MSSQPEAGDSPFNVGCSRSFVKKYKFRSIKPQTVPPGVPPYDLRLCADYATSKQLTKQITNIPASDLQYVTAPVEYVMESQKLRENDARLAEMRKTFAETRLDLNRQWERLNYDEVELKKGFLRFNQFVKENLEKRERASKKTGDDMILKQKRTAEVEILKQKLEVAYKCRKNVDRVIKQYSVFEGYLGDVVKNTEREFKTIDGIINKLETLNATRVKLVVKQESAMIALESAIQKMTTIESRHRLATLGLNNAIAILEERFKNVNLHLLAVERVVEKIKGASIQSTTEEHIVKSTIRNVYRHMCQRKSLRELTMSPDDYEGMLVFIKKSIEEIVKAQEVMHATVSKYKI